MVSVTTTSSMTEAAIRSLAGPLRTAWVAAARTLSACRALDRLGGVTERPSRIDHIIDQQRMAALDVPDEVHHLALVGALHAADDDRQVGAAAERRLELLDPAGIRSRPRMSLGSSTPSLAVVIGEETAHHRHEVEVIDRGVETLNLSCGNSIERTRLTPAADSRSATKRAEIGARAAPYGPAERSRNRGSRGGDVRRGRPLEGVDHHQQAHQMIVGGCARALDHEDVATAHRLHDVDVDLTVTKATHGRRLDGDAERLADGAPANCGQPLPANTLILPRVATTEPILTTWRSWRGRTRTYNAWYQKPVSCH